MSRSIVRHLTLAVTLVATLGLTLPASAAGHPHAAKAPMVAPGLLDQLLSWIGSLWSVQNPKAQGQMTGIPIPAPGVNGVKSSSSDSDHGGLIDPNG